MKKAIILLLLGIIVISGCEPGIDKIRDEVKGIPPEPVPIEYTLSEDGRTITKEGISFSIIELEECIPDDYISTQTCVIAEARAETPIFRTAHQNRYNVGIYYPDTKEMHSQTQDAVDRTYEDEQVKKITIEGIFYGGFDKNKDAWLIFRIKSRIGPYPSVFEDLRRWHVCEKLGEPPPYKYGCTYEDIMNSNNFFVFRIADII
ncbi:hypothetical protein KY360_01225 [Candidatus Woesearchaeota archaeon]|nr:hypothetical protein [Candidatus Woesearchaeota archaeon]